MALQCSKQLCFTVNWTAKISKVHEGLQSILLVYNLRGDWLRMDLHFVIWMHWMLTCNCDQLWLIQRVASAGPFIRFRLMDVRARASNDLETFPLGIKSIKYSKLLAPTHSADANSNSRTTSASAEGSDLKKTGHCFVSDNLPRNI